MIAVFKSARGYRWLAISSTAYRDRDLEIVSTTALKSAVETADPHDLGPLRFWHVPGLDVGTTDYQALTDDGKWLIESGLIPDAEIGQHMQQALKAGRYQMSIGFLHPLDEPKNGVFSSIRIFERSIVPDGRAANPQTTFGMGG
jgi:hypothetical protein